MADLTKFKPDGVTQMRVTRLTGWFVVSGGNITLQAGVSSATSGGQQCGITWTWSAAGDYRATLHRGYKRLIRGDVSISSGALGAVPTLANVANLAVANTGYFTGAVPVPATGGLGITTVLSSAAATKADPVSTAVVTYDFEFADI